METCTCTFVRKGGLTLNEHKFQMIKITKSYSGISLDPAKLKDLNDFLALNL